MELINNEYLVDGVSVKEISQKYELPLYLYESAKMQAQYMRMQKAFKGVNMKINYACKALSNINVLRFFRKLGSGLDTVSVQEVELGLQAGFEPSDIIFTPNCISFEELRRVAKKGVRVNIDNTSLLEQFGNEFHDTIPVCIRINPHIMAGGHKKISVGHIDSKFGISIYQLPHLKRIVKTYGLKVEGLHMHTGSDILDVGVFLQGAEILLQTAMQFPDLEYIDFGSGFKVAYKKDDIVTDIEALGADLSVRFKEFCKNYGRELTIIFEPGKFLVSEAGYFLVRVNVVKQTPSTVFAGVDSGMNHLIRPMFYNAYHHITNISNPEGVPRVYSVVGYICETDTFAYDRKIQNISENDILAFANAGAYCYAMSSNYNSRFRPAEVMIHKGKDYLIRRRETLDDLTRNQIEINTI